MALLLILGYLIGSIPFGYIFGKIKGIDIREVGFKRIGASNIYKIFGFLPALLVFFSDFLKPILSILIARAIVGRYCDTPLPYISGLFAIIGHNWPVWLKFKGEGRGMASSLGFLYFLAPIESIICFSFLLLLGLLIKIRGTAFFTFILFCIIPWVILAFPEPSQIFWLSISVSILLFVTRLIGGANEIKRAENKAKIFFNLLFFDNPSP